MKKLKVIFTIIIILVIVNLSIKVEAKTTGRNNKTDSTPVVKIVNCNKLTYKMLTNRKGKNIVYVERIKGKVVNKKLDGKILNCNKSSGNYISYKRVKGAKKGDTIITYCVYNPYSNAEDDIILRLDFIINR